MISKRFKKSKHIYNRKIFTDLTESALSSVFFSVGGGDGEGRNTFINYAKFRKLLIV